MSIGSIKDYTPNFKLIIPRFDLATWHDYIEQNFRSIDAMFYNLFAINDYKGEWKNSTTYFVGDTLFIGEDGGSDYEGRLVKVKVEHTTPASGTYSDELEAHPEYYDLYVDAAAATEAAQDAHEVLIDVQSLKNLCETYKNNAKTWAEGTDEEVQALGGTHSSKGWATGIDLSIDDLGGTDIDNPQDGEFLMFNDGKWVNTESSASVTWGGITGTLSNQLDLQEILDNTAHKTGNETINGAKTFYESSSGANLLQSTGSTISGSYVDFVQQINGARRGTMRTKYQSDGSYAVIFGCNGVNADAPQGITVIRDTSDNISVRVPNSTQTTSTDSQDVATVGWVNSANNNVVHRTGNETIGGTKTFSSTINGSINGNAATVTNGVYTTGNQTIGGTKTFSAVAYGKASDATDSILTTVAKTKAAKGGFKLGNGMIVNWGSFSGSGGTATYSIPFSGTNYGISMTRISANGTNDNDAITAVTSTNFSATIYQGGGAHWIAIGY